MHSLYLERWGNEASSSSMDMEGPLNMVLEDLATQRHRSALVEGSFIVDQWKGHTAGIDQCRMKMGLILTSGGDKFMRLWSSENYKCLEEYSLSDLAPLVDFDFDESKVVGLTGTRICIWRRNGTRSIFPSREGICTKGLCMRYMDPEAMVGCEDGTVRVFDMYSKSCSRIIRMQNSRVTCLAVGDDQLVLSGSPYGSIAVSGLLSNQQVATFTPPNMRGVETLCYNPCSHLVFAGSSNGYAACWDLRKMQSLWNTRVSPNAVYSMQYLRNDTSTLVIGGVDGVVRIVDQNTGKILTRCVMDPSVAKLTSRNSLYGSVERRKVKRLKGDGAIGSIPMTARPRIKCLAVGMGKVVTIHNTEYIRMWKFNK
ncbi:F-box/WD-40 repeat-containing protein At3g52030 isoform X2 [Spinacia oleracea]|nr:F-box/WD-40 repeat-containing protein At3g52030 isoform X2 [Spinacia oleracea]XP_056692163.1 F-box/WD-40 repeat-containing protein At3g52030 isoform X2 [Spinacia oleracea]